MKKHPILSSVLKYIKFDLEVMIELSNKLPNESKRPDAVIGGVALYLDEDHNAEQKRKDKIDNCMMRIFGMAPLRFDFKLIIDYIKGKSSNPEPLLEFRDTLFTLILGYLVQNEHLARHRIIFKKLQLSFMDDIDILTGKLKDLGNNTIYAKKILENIEYKSKLVENLSSSDVI